MMLIVTEAGVVKNQILPLGVDEKALHGLSGIINRRIVGLTANEIGFDTIEEIQHESENVLRMEPKVLIKIMNFIYEAIEAFDETHVFVENTKSILKYPEYSNLSKAQSMLEFLEDEKRLKQVIRDSDESGRVNIRIGGENGVEELNDCSLVTVNYSLDSNKSAGKIGVIGPKRMDYAKVIASLDCISDHIDKILQQLYIRE